MMYRKILTIFSVLFIIALITSCTSKPEDSLLKSYFNALSLNDLTTLSTMAIEPADLEVENWKIVSVTEEEISPVSLPEFDRNEQSLKEKVDEAVGSTLDARDAWDEADFEAKRTRTRAAREKAEELQAAYEKILEDYKELQREYNEAKADAKREEEITAFSLGVKLGDYPNIREFTGDVHSKEVIVEITDPEGNKKNYKVYMRKYLVKDEANNLQHRGRWIILKFESV
jgi:hypothetical protein